MSAPRFHQLRVVEVRPETEDCVSVSFEIPEELQEAFRYAPGQYLTIRKELDNGELRRSYSICSSPSDTELRIAVKQVLEGKFSGYVNQLLKTGDLLDVMTPMGKFTPKNGETPVKNYLAFAAGSGITPVISIMKHVLETNPESTFTLVYGNKSRNTIIFREAIEALKNKYLQRVRIYHVLSRETMDVPLFNGRIDAAKCAAFCDQLIDLEQVDEVFLCGPEEMILSVRDELQKLGLAPAKIHLELFTSPDQPKAKHQQWMREHEVQTGPVSKVTITLDGSSFDFDLPFNGDSLLDAALKKGADLPYACKGGVCCTCRARITEGTVEMEVNYALEPDEVAKGFVLTCQAHPTSERVVVDFDAR